jgi:multidrug efflux pump subunit AcrA (membrane-fusion protein)
MNSTTIKLKARDAIYRNKKESNIKTWFWCCSLSMVAILFLPWTQNIKSQGVITSLNQANRPQDLNSPIPGKIIKWWVKEGDFVQKGDTILQIAEIKVEYLDPNLIGRTKQQVDAKKQNLKNYEFKNNTANDQIIAFSKGKTLKINQLNNKIKQLENKILAEQAELAAITIETNLAKDQYTRQQKMFEEGLVSLTQLQMRNQIFQTANSKKIATENKLAQSQQEIGIIKIEQNSIEQDYLEKISKTKGDQFQNSSQIATSQGEIAKLENALTNYIIRNGMYLIIAPQAGQIVQTKKAGIGEIIKETEQIAKIIPNKMDYAVEMYVRPVDLPLINIGQKVRFMFDGFPAIIFSGWPNNTYGTFSGIIVAFENTISENGQFKVLVAEDNSIKKWPDQLKLGAGAQGITLLNDVQIWYELWRNINGFPPDFYIKKISATKMDK